MTDKNLHVLPTDHPSRLRYNIKTRIWELNEFHKYHTDIKSTHNIYITSDEEIKEGGWHYNLALNIVEKTTNFDNGVLQEKIILTTDQDLFADGVQEIDDKFLEWFCSKNGKVGYIESKQETLEGYEEALNQFPEYNQYLERIAFEKGVEWQQERSYNEEELRKIVKYAFNAGQRAESGKISKDFTLNRYLNSLKRNNGKKNK